MPMTNPNQFGQQQIAQKPRIGLLLGDPSGIGPEVLLKMLATPINREQAHIVVVGDKEIWRRTAEETGIDLPVTEILELAGDWHLATEEIIFLQGPRLEPSTYQQGEAAATAGRYVLDSCRVVLELAQADLLDGVCFAPFNKEAMHLAGSPFADDLRYFAHLLEFDEYVGELNVLEKLWTARVTSHIPLKDVATYITTENIENAVRLVDRSLRSAGFVEPRIAVAALNPHAGEGGLFGREEIDVIRPIVEQLASDLNVSGPYPSDTVFLRAQAGDFDAVVTMYHDQGQVAMKLMGFAKGVTVHGGLPVVVTTPAHGTAFDIAGQGKADSGAMTQAFQLACRMALRSSMATTITTNLERNE